MQDEHEGAPECDPQKKATEAIEKFEAKARRRAQRVTASRTGKVSPSRRSTSTPGRAICTNASSRSPYGRPETGGRIAV